MQLKGRAGGRMLHEQAFEKMTSRRRALAWHTSRIKHVSVESYAGESEAFLECQFSRNKLVHIS